MALYNSYEFARKCKISDAYLTMMKKRGKVVLTSDGKIDDTDPLNRLFVEHQAELALKREAKKKLVKSEANVSEDHGEEEKPVKSRTKKQNHEPVPGALSLQTLEKMNLDKKKREIEIEKMQRESRILSVQEQKLAGKLIPTDTVKALFAQHFKSIIMAFNQGIEQILVEFSTKYRLNRNEKAELKGHLIRIINKSVDESISLTKKDLQNIVMEYSQVKKLK